MLYEVLCNTKQSIVSNVVVPGDKSISHRCLILASQTYNEVVIHGLLESADVLSTIDALRLLGIEIICHQKNKWSVLGLGIGGLTEPSDVLQFNNSGTSARLFTGLLAPYGFNSFLTGDASLRSRPMGRVMTPLLDMGINFIAYHKNHLPMVVLGNANTVPITYNMPIPSAQVKSAILLAALNTHGQTTITESIATRDHTERLLQYMNYDIEMGQNDEGMNYVRLNGQNDMECTDLFVPSDPSSAAFIVAASLMHPESHITIDNVCINNTRMGFYDTVQKMGAKITFKNKATICNEPVCSIEVVTSALNAVEVSSKDSARMIDEYPILAVLAAFAKGTTKMRGLSELRFKESNRLTSIVDNLRACGVNVKIDSNDIIIEGTDGNINGGCTIKTFNDHRIAMAFFICGLITKQPVKIDNLSSIETSFPGFVDIMQKAFGVTINTLNEE